MTIYEPSLDFLAKPQADETVGSWLKRNALLNDNELSFKTRHMDGSGVGIPASLIIKWAEARNLTLEEAAALIKMKHTFLPLHRYFYELEFDYQHQKKSRMCSACISIDIAAKGFVYIRRSHNFPGVLVCHVHGNILQESCPHCYIPYYRHPMALLNQCGFGSKYRRSSSARFSTIDLSYARFINEVLATTMARPSQTALYLTLYDRGVQLGVINEWPEIIWKHANNYTVAAFSESPFKLSLQSLSPNVSVTMLPQMAKLAFALFRTAESYLDALAASAALHDTESLNGEDKWDRWGPLRLLHERLGGLKNCRLVR